MNLIAGGGGVNKLNKQQMKAVAEKLFAAQGANVANVALQAGKQWNGKIEFDDDEDDEEDESDNEAEIDAFLASAHDSRIPPTEALSRPLQYVVPSQKKVFGAAAKPPEVGKIPERCRFWPKCRNEEICQYSHPSKPCINFPNCWFGDKCIFIHPQCKFEPNCSKPSCPYTHTLPRPPIVAPKSTAPPPRQPAATQPGGNSQTVTGAEVNGTASVPNATAAESAKKPEETEAAEGDQTSEGEEKNVENDESKPHEASTTSETSDTEKTTEASQTIGDGKAAPDIAISTTKLSTTAGLKPLNTSLQAPLPPPTSNVQCRFGARCHSEVCTFRHPKRCRYDEACTNESCYFWHPKKNAGRFRWVKT